MTPVLRSLLLVLVVGCAPPASDEWTGSALEAVLTPRLWLVTQAADGETDARWTTLTLAPAPGASIAGATVTTAEGQIFEIRGARIEIPRLKDTLLAVRPDEPDEISLLGPFPWTGVRRSETLTVVVEASIDGTVRRFTTVEPLAEPAGIPRVLSPVIGASDVPLRPVVTWSMDGQADGIEIEIGPAAEGEDVAEGDDFVETLLPGDATSFELPEGMTLRSQTAYELRLRAIRGVTATVVSGGFTTTGVGAP